MRMPSPSAPVPPRPLPIWACACALALGSAHGKGKFRGGAGGPWAFAGEAQGITFHLRIPGECRDPDPEVRVKMANSLDYPVRVSFRIVDPDWDKAVEWTLAAGQTDSSFAYRPGGAACRPYIDQVYVEPAGAGPAPRREGEAPE